MRFTRRVHCLQQLLIGTFISWLWGKSKRFLRGRREGSGRSRMKCETHSKGQRRNPRPPAHVFSTAARSSDILPHMLLVIFGAGASYDSAPTYPPGTSIPAGDVLNGFHRPPLANELFANRPVFAEAIMRF